mmetsp:Transcript_42967/g.105958  ORF Transcript_42967/g.105958 Transcript_42967/m.105958 type:complete len:338 (+) Transcript_42967:629-1642(+)
MRSELHAAHAPSRARPRSARRSRSGESCCTCTGGPSCSATRPRTGPSPQTWRATWACRYWPPPTAARRSTRTPRRSMGSSRSTARCSRASPRTGSCSRESRRAPTWRSSSACAPRSCGSLRRPGSSSCLRGSRSTTCPRSRGRATSAVTTFPPTWRASSPRRTPVAGCAMKVSRLSTRTTCPACRARWWCTARGSASPTSSGGWLSGCGRQVCPRARSRAPARCTASRYSRTQPTGAGASTSRRPWARVRRRRRLGCAAPVAPMAPTARRRLRAEWARGCSARTRPSTPRYQGQCRLSTRCATLRARRWRPRASTLTSRPASRPSQFSLAAGQEGRR